MFEQAAKQQAAHLLHRVLKGEGDGGDEVKERGWGRFSSSVIFHNKDSNLPIHSLKQNQPTFGLQNDAVGK